MNGIPIDQVYALVKDYADYRGRPSTDAEVKAFVDRSLAKQPDPKDCTYADQGVCHFWGQGRWSAICVGLDNCKKAGLLLGVKL